MIDEKVRRLRVDLHCHSHASKDSMSKPDELIRMARRKGLDRIVITDHNTIRAAREAQHIDPERVIIGEEIMTSQGELLAVFVREEVPAGLEPEDAIRILRGQRAFISVSHPFDRMRNGSWKLNKLMGILPLVDAIEVFNARIMDPDANKKAMQLAREQGLAMTAGSDGHAAFEVGAAGLILPDFRNTPELLSVIREGELFGKQSPWWVHLFSVYAKNKKRVDGLA